MQFNLGAVQPDSKATIDTASVKISYSVIFFNILLPENYIEDRKCDIIRIVLNLTGSDEMSGICGFIDNLNLAEKKSVVKKMNERMVHRGPDCDGISTGERLALAYRSLNLSNNDAECESLIYKDGTHTILFSGRLYNLPELSERLESLGHNISGASGTADLAAITVLAAFREYGAELFDYLRGVFSFVVWDADEERLFAARDFFGTRPLYYAQIADGLVFASEIKSLLEHPAVTKEFNQDALASYLSFQYSVLPETFFKGIYRLEPAHYLVYEKGTITKERYYDFDLHNAANDNTTLEEWSDRIESAVQESIRLHASSAVEVGSFLSSGVDSSYVAASFGGKKTFTVGFSNEIYNESTAAKALADKIGIDNYSKLINPKEYWDIIPHAQYLMDEPLADPAAIALYFVSRLAAEQVKVVLSGEGADEFFAGYNIYKEPLSLAPMKVLPRSLRVGLGKLASSLPFRIKGKNYLIRASKELEDRFIGNANIFSESERRQILCDASIDKYSNREITSPFYERVKGLDDVSRMQYIDVNLWMAGDILLKADRMTAGNSIEVRSPFLDIEVAKLAATLPLHYKVCRENTKLALRNVAKRKLDISVANKRKLGFPVPMRVWLREEEYYLRVKDLFSSELAGQFFKVEQLLLLLSNHYNRITDNSRKIWTVYCFLIWYQEYFVKR